MHIYYRQLALIQFGKLFFLEMKGCRVHAVPQSGRFGSVFKNMTEVGSASGADNFGPGHTQTVIHLLIYVFIRNGVSEGRPAGTRLIFGF